MEPQNLVREVVGQLYELSDPVRLEQAKSSYPTSMTIVGVSVPNLRPIVKELNLYFKDRPPKELVAFARELNAAGIIEAQQIAFEVLDKNKAARRSLTLDDLLTLGDGIDNWLSVDCFAGFLAGPCWREGQISDELVESWAVSEDRWWRRAAVVSTVALNQKARGGAGDPDRTLKICRLVVADRDDMVAKALSWALRELAKRESEPVIEFIGQYEDVLPKRVVREVRSKIETGRKS